MIEDRVTIYNLIRLLGFSLGVINGINMRVRDDELKDFISNAYHEIDTSLNEIINKL